MKRTIVLELAEDTTATECGACPNFVAGSGGWSDSCSIFARFGRMNQRHVSCREAEQRAARMVEIDPRDAAYMDCACGEPSECTPAVMRVEAALRAHAEKCGATSCLTKGDE